MLSFIHIENIALIKSIDIDLSRGFSAFTGETGAGKSILIDSIGLISGAKASREIIRAGEQGALVEAMFTGLFEDSAKRCEELGFAPDEDGCLFIQRAVSADGRSTVRINGRQAPLSLLRELSGVLLNIHGQHDNQDLLKQEKHLLILDRFGDTETERADYTEVFREYRRLETEKSSLLLDDQEKSRRIDMLKYQISEIAGAKLRVGEEESLNAEKKRILNLEKITLNVSSAYDALYLGSSDRSAAEGLDLAIDAVRGMHDILEQAPEFAEKLEGMKYEIIDIAQILRDYAGDIEENPTDSLNRIEGRLDLIYRLKRKYGGDIGEILSFYQNAKKELSDIELSELRLSEIEKKQKETEARLAAAANRLSKKRREAAQKLSAGIENELQYLDMRDVRVYIDFSRGETYAPHGNEDVEFLVSTNKGEPQKPLRKTASGGELSRLMLAIKSVIAEKDGVETLIFDEIDAGISGKTSRRIGIKLAQTALSCQVLCVTHSAQIASLSDTHFLVSKGEKDARTETGVRKLSEEERVLETARIIAGMNITGAAMQTASELIKNRNETDINDGGRI